MFKPMKVPVEVNAIDPVAGVEQSTLKGAESKVPVVIVHGFNVMEIFEPLSVPIVAGFEDITLIRYAAPVEVPAGMIILIELPGFKFSASAPLKVPMLIGEAKLPAEFESWAVNIFPTANVPVDVKSIVPVSVVEQSTVNGPPVTFEVEMVLVTHVPFKVTSSKRN